MLNALVALHSSCSLAFASSIKHSAYYAILSPLTAIWPVYSVPPSV